MTIHFHASAPSPSQGSTAQQASRAKTSTPCDAHMLMRCIRWSDSNGFTGVHHHEEVQESRKQPEMLDDL